MSVPFSGGFTRSAGIYSAIGKQLKSVNLKPVKQVVFKFDPFRPNVKTIRYSIILYTMVYYIVAKDIFNLFFVVLEIACFFSLLKKF